MVLLMRVAGREVVSFVPVLERDWEEAEVVPEYTLPRIHVVPGVMDPVRVVVVPILTV